MGDYGLLKYVTFCQTTYIIYNTAYTIRRR